MSNLGLVLCLSLLAFGVAAAAGSLLSALAVRLAGGRLELLSPTRRARAYLRLRLAPAVVALVFTAGLFLPAFLLFEPRDASESVVAELLLLAALATVPLFRGLRQSREAWWATRAAKRACQAEGEPIGLPGFTTCPAYAVRSHYPVVAVVGIRRPVLVVSHAVLDTCTPDELEAVLAHETAHLERRDNLKRLLLRTAPDLLSWTGIAADVEGRWEQASEEAADDRVGRGRALDLASALLKIARLAVGPAPAPGTVAALCQGGDIARRVRRLTADPATTESTGFDDAAHPVATAVVLASGLALVASTGLLRHIHTVTEIVVASLQ